MIEVTKNLKKLNILYVEDDEVVNNIFSSIFKKYAKNLYSAFNGEEGLKIFKNNKIDIVISDIQMPKINGIEMAKEIRKIKEDIPIIFTTAFGDSEYLKEAIDIGIDAYILKPIDKEKMLKKLNKTADNLVLKQELENYTKLMKIIFDYQADGLILLDEDYNIVFYNKVAKDIMQKHNAENSKTICDIVKFEMKNDNVLNEEYFKNIDSSEKILCISYTFENFL